MCVTIKGGGGRKGVYCEMGDGYRIVKAHREFMYHEAVRYL